MHLDPKFGGIFAPCETLVIEMQLRVKFRHIFALLPYSLYKEVSTHTFGGGPFFWREYFFGELILENISLERVFLRESFCGEHKLKRE